MENPEQVKQQEVLPPQPSSKKKYIFIAGIVAVILGAGVLVLLMQKQVPPQAPEAKELDVTIEETLSDATASWQTYRNDEFGFELNYPEEFSVVTSEYKKAGRDDIFVIKKDNDSSFEGLLGTSHSVLIDNIPDVSSAQKCYTKTDDGTPLTQHRLINGEGFYYSDTLEGVGVGADRWTAQEYKVFKHNTCFGIAVLHVAVSGIIGRRNPDDIALLVKIDREEAFEVFDQILSTFRFSE